MEIQEIKNKNFAPFWGLISLFLVALIIFTAVEIINKMKEGKYIGQGITNTNTISVSGTGDVYAKPDLAIVDFSVINNAKTVASAMADNTDKMNAVTDFMKQQGIKEEDLKTINFNISPHYEYYDASECIKLYGTVCPNGRQVLTGYDVTQTLEVKIRDLSKIGDIIQGGTDKGSNQVGDINFTIDKEDDIKAQARQQAIEQAKAKARELASQLGIKLIKIVNFSESGVVPYYDMSTKAIAPLGAGASAPPQIQTGQNKIEVSVNITYEIN
jgi:hypothetical protein